MKEQPKPKIDLETGDPVKENGKKVKEVELSRPSEGELVEWFCALGLE